MTKAVASATMLASIARYRSRIGERSAIIASRARAIKVLSGARIKLASASASCNPKVDCHITMANDAAVIAHEPAIAIHATRSPLCLHREPMIAAAAAISGGPINQRSCGTQTLRTCQP